MSRGRLDAFFSVFAGWLFNPDHKIIQIYLFWNCKITETNNKETPDHIYYHKSTPYFSAAATTEANAVIASESCYNSDINFWNVAETNIAEIQTHRHSDKFISTCWFIPVSKRLQKGFKGLFSRHARCYLTLKQLNLSIGNWIKLKFDHRKMETLFIWQVMS